MVLPCVMFDCFAKIFKLPTVKKRRQWEGTVIDIIKIKTISIKTGEKECIGHEGRED